MKARFLRLGKVFLLALAHGAADLSIAGHFSAHGKGAADPEMLD